MGHLLPTNGRGWIRTSKLEDMNEIAVIKQVWRILAGEETVWTNWVSKVLLKKEFLWSINQPSNPSWVWRNILKRREFVKSHTKTIIGNGKRISFWFDVWCSFVPLCRNIEEAPWNSVNVERLTKVADIICDGRWNIEGLQLEDEMKRVRYATPIHENLQDRVVWLSSNTHGFSNRLIWDLLRQRGEVGSWKYEFWFKRHVPRFSFSAWLVHLNLNRLPTRDRLLSWGVPVAAGCLFCNKIENRDHLSFECQYSKTIWQQGIYYCCIQNISLTWHEAHEWMENRAKGNSFKEYVLKLFWTAATYRIWQQRNARLHRGNWSSERELMMIIKRDVLFRCNSLSGIGISDVNMEICSRWSIPTSILE